VRRSLSRHARSFYASDDGSLIGARYSSQQCSARRKKRLHLLRAFLSGQAKPSQAHVEMINFGSDKPLGKG